MTHIIIIEVKMLALKIRQSERTFNRRLKGSIIITVVIFGYYLLFAVHSAIRLSFNYPKIGLILKDNTI